MRKTILFVDDEKYVLKSLNRLFINTDYQVFLAGNGQEALKILADEKIDLIITDMKMPLMNGYDLLKEVKRLYPEIMRLILSGYAEKDLVFQSARENLVLFYILKPWDNDKLYNLVSRLFIINDTLKSKNMLKIVNDWEDSLFLKEPLNSLIMADEFINTINIPDNHYLSRDKFLRHTKLTNKIVNIIYGQLLKKKLPENYLSAGLLHNIGIILMLSVFQEQYVELLADVKTNKSLSSVDREEERFSINHQEVGGYLLSWWGLPYPILETAFFHHTPTSANVLNKEIVCAVNIAAYYAWRIIDSDYAEYTQEAFEYLGLNKEKVGHVVEALH